MKNIVVDVLNIIRLIKEERTKQFTVPLIRRSQLSMARVRDTLENTDWSVDCSLEWTQCKMQILHIQTVNFEL